MAEGDVVLQRVAIVEHAETGHAAVQEVAVQLPLDRVGEQERRRDDEELDSRR